MKRLVLTAALGAACFGLAACGERRDDNMAANDMSEMNSATSMGEGEGGTGADDNMTASGSGSNMTASAFPRGARIVEEGGVTYRIDANGTRVRLTDADSRILVENGVRYRVDPGGTRVKINDRGIDIDGPDIDVPDVDVGVNEKGNLDIDVQDKSDGDTSVNRNR